MQPGRCAIADPGVSGAITTRGKKSLDMLLSGRTMTVNDDIWRVWKIRKPIFAGQLSTEGQRIEVDDLMYIFFGCVYDPGIEPFFFF
jgi:hypothetical protein